MPDLYRGMNAAELDRAYDNAAAFPDVPGWRDRWAARSEIVGTGADALLDLPYGPDARQKLDVFPCGKPNAPTVLFFHGGFWSRNGKETFRFLREAFARAGMNSAFAGYRLAPGASMDEIAADAEAACIFLQANLGRYSLAERDLVLVGWSAGAHLVAQLMHRPGIAAGIAVSGLYDLIPMQLSGMNATLRLDPDQARRHSPIFHPPEKIPPLLIAYGAGELPEFQRQSVDFHAAWAKAELDVRLLALEGRHHHASLDEFHEPEGVLSEVLYSLREALK